MKAKIKKFVPNEEDNLHCFQSCFKMVYDYFFNTDIPMSTVEKMTNFMPGKPTWPYAGMLSLANAGLTVLSIEAFDVHKFIEHPEKTIKDHVDDEEIAQFIINESILEKERKFAFQCIQHSNIIFDKKIPGIEDIKFLLEKDWIVIVNVNYYALLDEDKYYGHFVIVEDINSSKVLLQNPGLPPIQNQTVSIRKFINAWQYPNENLSNVLAINRAQQLGALDRQNAALHGGK